uniref:MSP domain-containing protein n=1 Tax=Heterorhabditis bacteriophora TaxID=37862 RepID=A0A1I7WPV9_HETBA
MRNLFKIFRRDPKVKKVSFGNDAVRTFIYEKESEEPTPIIQRQSFTDPIDIAEGGITKLSMVETNKQTATRWYDETQSKPV